jgi:hypothetical protein
LLLTLLKRLNVTGIVHALSDKLISSDRTGAEGLRKRYAWMDRGRALTQAGGGFSLAATTDMSHILRRSATISREHSGSPLAAYVNQLNQLQTHAASGRSALATATAMVTNANAPPPPPPEKSVPGASQAETTITSIGDDNDVQSKESRPETDSPVEPVSTSQSNTHVSATLSASPRHEASHGPEHIFICPQSGELKMVATGTALADAYGSLGLARFLAHPEVQQQIFEDTELFLPILVQTVDNVERRGRRGYARRALRLLMRGQRFQIEDVTGTDDPRNRQGAPPTLPIPVARRTGQGSSEARRKRVRGPESSEAEESEEDMKREGTTADVNETFMTGSELRAILHAEHPHGSERLATNPT